MARPSRDEQSFTKTVCASGAAGRGSAREAIKSALAEAQRGLKGRSADVGLVFASARLALAEAMSTAKQTLPHADFLACSSAGEITDLGLTRGGVAVLLISWGEASHTLSLAAAPHADPAGLADSLCGRFADQAHARAEHPVCVLLGDGLSPMFEKVVARIGRSPGKPYAVVGGGAADEWEFRQTTVAANARVAAGGMAALHVASKKPWGIGVAHGLRVVSPRMTVTRADGNWVREIDDRPVLDIYRTYASGRGLALDDATLLQFLVENELGVLLFEDVVRVRAAIKVEPDGALLFAGEVPEGSSVCIVRGDHDEVIAAARSAAEEAARGLEGARAAGILVFSCVCRDKVLGERYADEILAIRAVFADAPIVGFSSYGEVARTTSKLDGYHNNTIVVAAIPE